MQLINLPITPLGYNIDSLHWTTAKQGNWVVNAQYYILTTTQSTLHLQNYKTYIFLLWLPDKLEIPNLFQQKNKPLIMG